MTLTGLEPRTSRSWAILPWPFDQNANRHVVYICLCQAVNCWNCCTHELSLYFYRMCFFITSCITWKSNSLFKVHFRKRNILIFYFSIFNLPTGRKMLREVAVGILLSLSLILFFSLSFGVSRSITPYVCVWEKGEGRYWHTNRQTEKRERN